MKGTQDDINVAMEVARAAYKKWSREAPGNSEKILLACATAVDEFGPAWLPRGPRAEASTSAADGIESTVT